MRQRCCFNVGRCFRGSGKSLKTIFSGGLKPNNTQARNVGAKAPTPPAFRNFSASCLVDLRIGDTPHRAAPVCTVKDSQCVPEERA
jgi:hypothetical protein